MQLGLQALGSKQVLLVDGQSQGVIQSFAVAQQRNVVGVLLAADCVALLRAGLIQPLQG